MLLVLFLFVLLVFLFVQFAVRLKQKVLLVLFLVCRRRPEGSRGLLLLIDA